MRRGRRTQIATSCGHLVGVANLLLLILSEPTTLTLGVAVALAPFTLATALKLTAFLACSVVSLALGDRRERGEVLICAISAVQPPHAGEQYREAMLGEIRAAELDQVRAIRTNLMATAPRTILAAWGRLPRPLVVRIRNAGRWSPGRRSEPL